MTVTNMKYYITQGGLNWADEIDFEGFDLFTEDQLKDAIKAFSKGGEYYDKSVNAYLGTNEDEEVSSEDVLYELKEAEEITEALQGGENPIVGLSYDIWNTLGIPWSMYNYYHELGWSDEDIKTHRDNLLKIARGNYPETDKIRAYQKKLDNAVWY